jgi:hypothetical protein
MKEATFHDAETLGQLLNLDKREVWKVIQGIRYTSLNDLGMAVHHAFERDSGPTQRPGVDPKSS